MRLTNEELIQIIKEELEAVIDEKKGKKRKAAKKKRRKKKKKKKAKRDACYNKVKSRLGFIGEIGFPLYRAVSCIRQRLDKEKVLSVNTEVDELCLDKTKL